MILAALVVATGCGSQLRGSTEIKPGQMDAERIAWTTVYGIDSAPPPVYWVEGNDLNCDDGFGWLDEDRKCVAGKTFDGEWGVQLGWFRDSDSFSGEIGRPINGLGVSMAHEFYHVIWGDQGHHDPAWRPGGLVDQANQKIVDAGL